MNGGSPVEVSSQVVFRSVKGTLGEGDDSTVCTQQQRRREKPSAFSLGFSGFNGFKRHGIKGQLKAVFVEDVGFVIALGHGADFAGRHLLERVPSCWFIFVEGSQTSPRLQVHHLERAPARYVEEGPHQIRTPAEVHVHPVDDRPVRMTERGIYALFSSKHLSMEEGEFGSYGFPRPTVHCFTLHPSTQQPCIR